MLLCFCYFFVFVCLVFFTLVFFFFLQIVCLITLASIPNITDYEYISTSVHFMGQCSTITWIPQLLPLLWGSNFSLSSLPDLRVEDSPKARYVYHPPSPALRANQTNCWTVYCVTYAKTTSNRFPLLEMTRSKSVWCLVGFRVCACVCRRKTER